MKNRLYLYTALIMLLLGINSKAQDNEHTEKELKKEAETCLKNNDYLQATRLFSQLLSLNPNDAYYHYKFGICLLENGQDKGKALEYILTASEDPSIESKVFFYLGRAYHYNYEFDDAIDAYSTYINYLSKWQKKEINRTNILIKMCNNGKTLLKYIHGLDVYDKKEIDKKKFYRVYDLSERSGEKIVAKPKDFQSFKDKMMNEFSVVFKSDTNEAIYYSSYGKLNSKTGKDIYKVLRMPNGKWSKPERLPATVNTDYDEDFPYLHADGKSFYFCSKGHNSMGGYDIFRCIYNADSNTWSNPENLDFPINSPADDIFYMPDLYNRYAFFASTRASAYNAVHTYKIDVPEEPMPYTVIKGKLNLENPDDYVQGRITVFNIETDELIGMYQTNTQSELGKYVLILPPNEYRFVIEHPGYETKETILHIPVQTQFTALKQEITLGKSLKIFNSFKSPQSDEYLTAIEFIQKQAQLSVNAIEKEDTNKNSKNQSTINTNKTDTSNNLKNNISQNHLNKDNTTHINKNNHQTTNNNTTNNNSENTTHKNTDTENNHFQSTTISYISDSYKITCSQNNELLKNNENIKSIAYAALYLRQYPDANLHIIGYVSSTNTSQIKKHYQTIKIHLTEKYKIKPSKIQMEINKTETPHNHCIELRAYIEK